MDDMTSPGMDETWPPSPESKIIAGKNGDKTNVVNEVADLVYHLMVLLAYMDIPLEEVLRELERRRKEGKGGHS